MKLLRYFDAFLDDVVNLNQTRLNRLGEHVEAVTNFLGSCDRPIAEKFVQTIPQGSYAHRTIIKPVGDNDEFDADLLLDLSEDADWAAEDYVRQLYAAFRSSPTYKDKVGIRTRCVTINYAGDFHLDVVPYLERHGERFITNRKDNDFELTNPDGFTAWLDEKNRTTGGRLIKVIRLMKYIRDYKNTFSVKSFILTMLLADRVNDAVLLLDAKYYSDVPTVLKNVLSSLDEYLQKNEEMPMLTDPSCPTEDFNHRWSQQEYETFRKKVKHYSAKVTSAYEEEGKDKSVALWQEVFGSNFKQPTSTVTAALSVKDVSESSGTEQFIDSTLGFPVALNMSYRLRIEGRVLPKDGFRTPRGKLRARGGIVDKDRRIQFEIVDCTVPKPFDVYWKIKNRGDAALQAKCLRGEIVADKGSHRRVEPTKYPGSHYVECYVVKNGICVAMDHQPVIIT